MLKATSDVTSTHAAAPKPAPAAPETASRKLRALAGGGFDAAASALVPPPEISPPGALGSNGASLKVEPGAALKLAREVIAGGVRDEAAVTDAVFYGLFPQLEGQKLKTKSAEAKAWLEVRDVGVRPALAEPPPDKETNEAPRPEDEKKAPPNPDKGAGAPDQADTKGASDKAHDAPAPTPPMPAPSPSKDEPSLTGSVGEGGQNLPADVAWVAKKLQAHGIAAGSTEKELATAIRTYEARALNRSKSAKGVVKPGDYVHHALLAGAAPAPIAVADPGALVAASKDSAVVALRKAVDDTRALRDGIRVDSGEEAGAKDGTDAAKRDELVTRIAALRAQIAGMNLAGVSAEEARAIRAWGYRQVNELSPYYSQGRNANLLEGTSTRTCNLTSLAMTLEALGVTPASYTGDLTVIQQIRNASKSQGGATKKELDAAWGQNKDKQGVDGLRMPDFLQMVAVAHEMEKGRTVMQGLVAAWDAILSAENLRTYAAKFGVKAWVRYGAGSAKGKGVAQQWQDTLGAELDAGRQVVILLPGHFVRLQAVAEDGIIVDDPAKGTKKNRPMPFKEVSTFKMVVLG